VSELWRKGAVELAALICDREVSSREVVQEHLDRIEAVNPHLNAIVRSTRSLVKPREESGR
jgi:amidase